MTADLFFTALKMSSVATILTDPHRRDNPIIFANDAFCTLIGFPVVEIIGRNCRFLRAPDSDPATVGKLREAIAGHHSISIEILNRRRDGTDFWAALTIAPIFDDDGSLRHFIGNYIDISHRRASENALHRLQKMEAIGQLTSGVAHDFNNLLTVIITSVESLRRGKLSQEKRNRYIDAIGATADRAAKLTGQLLAFARKRPVEPTIFDPSEQVRRTVDMLRTIVGSRIKITTDLARDPCLIKADISQFETALVNIVVYGRDAMQGQGLITITVAQVPGIPALRDQHAVTGAFIGVTVTDTGAGIPGDRLDRIFEPLYTTKAAGLGTGLGMSQVQGFARQAGGEVRVVSQPDHGTTFLVYLPCAEAGALPDLPRASLVLVGHGRLLMVEHHVQIAAITSEILKDLGYDVRCVTNASAALAAIKADERGFDLVFSDVLVPGPMSGIDLAHELRHRWPGLPVLLTTGYSNVLAKDDDMNGDFKVLRKPYSAEALTSLINEMIQGADASAAGLADSV